MRVIAKMDNTKQPPLLQMSIHGAPHRRQHHQVLQQYRMELKRALREEKITTPINYTVDLWLLFVDPSSPDYDNLLTALFRAMDAKSLKGPGVLRGDSYLHIGAIRYLSAIFSDYTKAPA